MLSHELDRGFTIDPVEQRGAHLSELSSVLLALPTGPISVAILHNRRGGEAYIKESLNAFRVLGRLNQYLAG